MDQELRGNRNPHHSIRRFSGCPALRWLRPQWKLKSLGFSGLLGLAGWQTKARMDLLQLCSPTPGLGLLGLGSHAGLLVRSRVAMDAFVQIKLESPQPRAPFGTCQARCCSGTRGPAPFPNGARPRFLSADLKSGAGGSGGGNGFLYPLAVLFSKCGSGLPAIRAYSTSGSRSAPLGQQTVPRSGLTRTCSK